MSKSIRWYWVGLLLLLLATRLSALNVALLVPDEARIALQAQSVAQAGQWPLSTGSPLLLVGNALLFRIFGSGSGLARLLPATAGVLLALVPWLWRDRLSLSDHRDAGHDFTAWSAVALLVFSPIALFVGRQVSGTSWGVLGGALVITALFTPPVTENEHRISWLLGAGLAVGLTGGASFYDVLLPGLLAWAMECWVEGRSLSFSRAHLRAVGLGLLLALLISLGLGWRWNGWAGPVEGLAAWLREWRGTGAVHTNPFLLLLYEPLLLLLAAMGLWLAARRNGSSILVLAAWAVLAILLVVLRPGALPGAFLAPLLPLALLGGWAVQHLVLPRRLTGDIWMEVLHTTLGLVLWAFIALVLLRQTGAPAYANGLELPLVVLVLVIHGLMAAGFATMAGARRAVTGVMCSLIAVLCLLQVAFGIGVTFLRPGDPAEPLVVTGVSDDLRNLRRTIEDIRIARGLSPEALVLVAVENNPAFADVWAAVRWALQPVPLSSVAAWPVDAPQMVLTLETVAPPAQGSSAYSGMSFGAIQLNSAAVAGCEEGIFPPVCTHPLAWYFYRRMPAAPRVTRVILWARLPDTP